MLKSKNCRQTIMVAIYIQFCMSNSLHVIESFIKTVLLESINERYQVDLSVYHCAQSYDDCSIRVYPSFTTIFYKCLILLFYSIMLALCFMLSITYYAQNYAGIIGGSSSHLGAQFCITTSYLYSFCLVAIQYLLFLALCHLLEFCYCLFLILFLCFVAVIRVGYNHGFIVCRVYTQLELLQFLTF